MHDENVREDSGYRTVDFLEERPRQDLTMIRVWAWRDAPQELRVLSNHGGDEDWVAAIPPEAYNRDPYWADSGTNFGCCDVEAHELPAGWRVLIGAHA